MIDVLPEVEVKFDAEQVAEGTLTPLVTAEQLAKMPPPDGFTELVEGVIYQMPPAGHDHGERAGNMFLFVAQFVRQHKLGKVYAAETGFILKRNPDTVRAPDVAFVTAVRAAAQTRREGFFDGYPDLAVEVISPSETAEQIQAKVQDYLQAGTRLVWLVYPTTQTVTAYGSLQDIRVYTIEDTLTGAEVLPDFSLPVRDIFA